MKGGIITTTSGVSATDYRPYCAIHWGDESGILSVEETREFALALLRCAEAAEQDAFIMRSLDGELGKELAIQIVGRIRFLRYGSTDRSDRESQELKEDEP